MTVDKSVYQEYDRVEWEDGIEVARRGDFLRLDLQPASKLMLFAFQLNNKAKILPFSVYHRVSRVSNTLVSLELVIRAEYSDDVATNTCVLTWNLPDWIVKVVERKLSPPTLSHQLTEHDRQLKWTFSRIRGGNGSEYSMSMKLRLSKPVDAVKGLLVGPIRLQFELPDIIMAGNVFSEIKAETIKFLLLVSRQGKLRLAKWYEAFSLKERQKLVKDVSQLVLARKSRLCNFIEYKDMNIIYKRYQQWDG